VRGQEGFVISLQDELRKEAAMASDDPDGRLHVGLAGLLSFGDRAGCSKRVRRHEHGAQAAASISRPAVVRAHVSRSESMSASGERMSVRRIRDADWLSRSDYDFSTRFWMKAVNGLASIGPQ
jgi:hypothetical protein